MPEGSFPAPRAGRFATTRWSLVLAAGQKSDARSADALTGLCEMYWYPVYAFIRRQGYRAGGMRGPDAGILRARAREELLSRRRSGERAAFAPFSAPRSATFSRTSAIARGRLKRGGTSPPISLDVETAEGTYRLEPRDDLTPEKLFDRRWALILLERVLARLRDNHASAGKGELFDRLKGFLTGDSAGLPYAEVAKALGMTEGAVKVAVHRLRRNFRDTLIQEIAETVSEPADIDAEIEYLMKAVSE